MTRIASTGPMRPIAHRIPRTGRLLPASAHAPIEPAAGTHPDRTFHTRNFPTRSHHPQPNVADLRLAPGPGPTGTRVYAAPTPAAYAQPETPVSARFERRV